MKALGSHLCPQQSHLPWDPRREGQQAVLRAGDSHLTAWPRKCPGQKPWRWPSLTQSFFPLEQIFRKVALLRLRSMLGPPWGFGEH